MAYSTNHTIMESMNQGDEQGWIYL